MALEYCAGAVVFRKENNKFYYLLLRYPTSGEKEYWGLVKGHIEKGEGLIDTAQREVQEETGLSDIKFIEGFREREKYIFLKNKKIIYKIVTLFLAETKTKDIIISPEHLGYIWLEFSEACEQLTYKNAKTILQKAHQFIQQQDL